MRSLKERKNMETRRKKIKDKCRKCLSETLDQEWT